jgi:hypothetical protein
MARLRAMPFRGAQAVSINAGDTGQNMLHPVHAGLVKARLVDRYAS